MKLCTCALALLATIAWTAAASAHDTWVQTNTNIIRTGDAVFVDLMLGNHGNEHRDFKLASKIDIDKCTLTVLAPDSNSYDLKPSVVDTGYAPKEGYWSAKFAAAKPGMYAVAHTLDTLHKTTRAIKSGKTFFIVSNSLDKVAADTTGFDQPLGHPFELVPEKNPVAPMGPDETIRVKLLYNGRPMANTRVSFIPRGVALEQGFDSQYERMTDEQGRASFTPTEGNYVLVVAHHTEPEQKGDGYDRTAYSATLTVFVPELCPCCE